MAKQAIKDLTQKELESIRDKLNLSRTPTHADIEERVQTGSFSRSLTESTSTPSTPTPSSPAQDGVPPESDIYSQRDQYLQNILGATGREFDIQTDIQVTGFERQQADAERDIENYREDFEKMTSRKSQDYYTGVALRDKEFSQSLDRITNFAARTIGSFAGIGKSRITEATEGKIEQASRYQLAFGRSVSDAATAKERAESRYKLGTSRLAEGKEQYLTAREKSKEVGKIETTGEVSRYYDDLIRGRILAEDEKAAGRKLIGGGTGIEESFSF